ncbi:MAG: APC family permease [Gemmatimonadetes bacterium]|nr:APC family permease [Gemmatimonadota bacterium]
MPIPSVTPAEPALDRALGRRDLSAFAVNRVIGAGIFGIPAVLYAGVGPYSVAAMVCAALAVSLITLCFAEVGSRFSDTGGPYLYAYRAFGPVVGFEVGWLMWVTQLGGFAAVTNLMVNYAGWFVPGITTGVWRAAVILAVVVVLAMVNVLGIRRAALVNTALTIGKLAPLALFIVVGSFYLDVDLFRATGSMAAGGGGTAPGMAAMASTVFLAIYAFSGFETLGVPAGEVRDPVRTIPFALLAGLAVVATVYVGVQVVAVGTLPDLGTSARPLADAAARLFGPVGAAVMVVGALVSTLGVAHAIILAAGRMPFAMAERGQLWPAIAAVHPKYQTPFLGILVSAGGMLLFTLMTTFTSALTITVGLRVIIYLVTCAALPVLRRSDDSAATVFRVPAGRGVSALCVGMCAVLLLARPIGEMIQFLVVLAIGLLLWWGSTRLEPRPPA